MLPVLLHRYLKIGKEGYTHLLQGSRKQHTHTIASPIFLSSTERKESPKHPAHKRRKAGPAPKYKQVQTLSLMEIKHFTYSSSHHLQH